MIVNKKEKLPIFAKQLIELNFINSKLILLNLRKIKHKDNEIKSFGIASILYLSSNNPSKKMEVKKNIKIKIFFLSKM